MTNSKAMVFTENIPFMFHFKNRATIFGFLERFYLYTRQKFVYMEISIKWSLMHQSFVVPTPTGPGNSGAFNFSVFKALLNALHCGDKFMVKSLLKAPAPRRLTIMKNNK